MDVLDQLAENVWLEFLNYQSLVMVVRRRLVRIFDKLVIGERKAFFCGCHALSLLGIGSGGHLATRSMRADSFISVEVSMW